jgi:hypothetical protein
MTKYLTTYEELNANIGKRIKIREINRNYVFEGILCKEVDTGRIFCNDCENIAYFFCEITTALEIELIEEDNQESYRNDIAITANIVEEKPSIIINNKEYLCQVSKDSIMEQPVKPNDNNYNPVPQAKHYQLVINDKIVDVNMILEAISKKLDGKCDLMMWNYFSNATEYLMRSWFKGQQLSDLKKAKSEIEFMINKLEK